MTMLNSNFSTVNYYDVKSNLSTANIDDVESNQLQS